MYYSMHFLKIFFKWPFISLILSYLKLQGFFKYTFKIKSTQVHFLHIGHHVMSKCICKYGIWSKVHYKLNRK